VSASAADDGGDAPVEEPVGFDLRAAYDDPDDPETVTIHPADPEEPTTEWLTIDADLAVPVEETV